MSFFRNLRSSITRGRSSSRDTTPVRNSRPGSVLSSHHSSSSKRRDSLESRPDSLLNRSDTFILDDPYATPCHSNCSTLEKKSKKSKVLEKFSTFTKRKKPPPSDNVTFEHHPSDNATNTYYKWQAEGGGNSLDYDAQNDPFNFLYEQQASLKSLNNHGDSSNSFDSSTYRKSKVPSDLKKQIKMLKDQDVNSPENHTSRKNQGIKDEEEEDEEQLENEKSLKSDKYKTVTLNSFRRSFREKFLQQQKEAAYNPAWFVKVETPDVDQNRKEHSDCSKENRRDLLVFENENYRPGSRSPVRDLSNRKEVRTNTRSPVKRNETFKVERLNRLDQQTSKTKPEENTGSIHIEFKNSITPHIPGRMVPVGVAKPMPSHLNNASYYRKIETPPSHTSYPNKPLAGTTTTRLNNHSPTRSPWLRTQSPARTATSNPTRLARYQSLVQIKNEKSQQVIPSSERNSRHSTRIQLVGNTPSNPRKKSSMTTLSPSFDKRYNTAQLLGNSSGSKMQPLKQTYFGDIPQTAKITQIPSNLSSSTSGLRTRQTETSNYGSYKYHTPATLFASASSLATSASPITSSYTTPSYSVNNIHNSTGNSYNNLSYGKHNQQQQQQAPQQQKQTRFIVPGQRRSRSPIKIPWR